MLLTFVVPDEFADTARRLMAQLGRTIARLEECRRNPPEPADGFTLQPCDDCHGAGEHVIAYEYGQRLLRQRCGSCGSSGVAYVCDRCGRDSRRPYCRRCRVGDPVEPAVREVRAQHSAAVVAALDAEEVPDA